MRDVFRPIWMMERSLDLATLRQHGHHEEMARRRTFPPAAGRFMGQRLGWLDEACRAYLATQSSPPCLYDACRVSLLTFLTSISQEAHRFSFPGQDAMQPRHVVDRPPCREWLRWSRADSRSERSIGRRRQQASGEHLPSRMVTPMDPSFFRTFSYRLCASRDSY